VNYKEIALFGKEITVFLPELAETQSAISQFHAVAASLKNT
jgi:hypothetical protein